MYENFDLHEVVTPVKHAILEELLVQYNYPQDKTNFLVQGFKSGFSIKYNGPKNVTRLSNNLHL